MVKQNDVERQFTRCKIYLSHHQSDSSVKHNELEAVAEKTENPGKTPAPGRISVWVPGVFEETGWKNPEQRDNVCLNRLRSATSDAIAFVIFLTSIHKYIYIIKYACYYFMNIPGFVR